MMSKPLSQANSWVKEWIEQWVAKWLNNDWSSVESVDWWALGQRVVGEGDQSGL